MANIYLYYITISHMFIISLATSIQYDDHRWVVHISFVVVELYLECDTLKISF